jgi:hypothetical protein
MNFKKESKSFVNKQSDREYSPCLRFNGKDHPKFSSLSVFSCYTENLYIYRVRFNLTKVHKVNHEFKLVTQGKEVVNKVTFVKYFGLTME